MLFSDNSSIDDTFFQCQDGRWLPAEHYCNFKEECLNGDDEIGCESTVSCGQQQFRCSSGECITSEYRCDGQTNCWDKSDEIGCGK